MPGFKLTVTFKSFKDGSALIAAPIAWNITDPDKGDQLLSGDGITDQNGRWIADLNLPDRVSYKLTWTCHGEQGSFPILPKAILDAKLSQNVVVQCMTSTFTNPGRNWLSYETRYNWAPYCKLNSTLQMNFYRVEASGMLLLLAPRCDVDDETLQLLGGVFFPGIDLKHLRDHGKAPWEGLRMPFSSPSQNSVNGGPFAVLPYNARDNTGASVAIGTKVKSRVHNLQLTPLVQTLPMWNTASRSSIACFSEPINPLKTFKPDYEEDLMWPEYGARNPFRFLDQPSAKSALDLTTCPMSKMFSVKTGVDLIGFEFQPKKAKLEHNSILAALRSAYIRQIEAELYPKALSDDKMLILTEIMTVTEADPNWDAWIGSKMGADNPCSWSMQTTASTQSSQSTAVSTSGGPKQPELGDGFQVRSLKGMTNEKGYGYFPPTSLPFVSVTNAGAIDEACTNSIMYGVPIDRMDFFARGMPRSIGVFSEIDNPVWREFWKKHYAAALGRTKARLLLRYGLQGFGGNAQNFLLEMKDGVPNGRIVVRDMGDYALHDFVLWALFGPGKGPAPDPRGQGPGKQEDFVRQWRDAFRNSKSSVGPLLWFECSVLHDFTHKGDQSEYPTFTGYHRWPVSEMHTFNPFCKCCDDVTAPFVGHISPLWAYALPVSPQKMNTYNCDLTAARWAEVFKVEAEWGIAHAKAWMEYFEAALGAGFTKAVASKIDWTPLSAIELTKRDGDGWKSSKSGRVHSPSDYTNKDYLGVDLTKQPGKPLIQDQGFEAIRGKWEDVYKQMKSWEMYLGMQVENYLMTEEGQDAIRSYSRGGWRAVEASPYPKVGIRISMTGLVSGAPAANSEYTLQRNGVSSVRRLSNDGKDVISFGELFGPDNDQAKVTITVGGEIPVTLPVQNRSTRSDWSTRYSLRSFNLDVSYGPDPR